MCKFSSGESTFVFRILIVLIKFIRKSSVVSKTRCYFYSKIATSLAFDVPLSESPEPSSQSALEASPRTVFRPQKFQISTQATQDDPIYLASEGALRSLFSFFTGKLMAKCCFCGKDFDAESVSFKRQGHAVSVNISCLCGDSMKWLSSPIMGGPKPKYYVNMRYVDIVHLSITCC